MTICPLVEAGDDSSLGDEVVKLNVAEGVGPIGIEIAEELESFPLSSRTPRSN